MVRSSTDIERETLKTRGDPRLVSSAVVYFEEDEAGRWVVKAVDSLHKTVVKKSTNKLQNSVPNGAQSAGYRFEVFFFPSQVAGRRLFPNFIHSL